VCQLRVPKSAAPDPKETRVSLASHRGETAYYLWGYNQKEQKEGAGFVIFEPDHFLLLKEPDNRRALIIGTSPAQVFLLSFPSNPKAGDWSQWRRPDFLATGDVGWAFIYNQNPHGVSTNIPANAFELRYKIQMTDLGPSYETLMKQKRNSSK
jgi:hypothetical protein